MKIIYCYLLSVLLFAFLGCSKVSEKHIGNGYVVKYEYFQDGQIKSKTTFLGDKKWGSHKVYYRQWRTRLKETFFDDKREGKSISYYDKGQKKSVIYYKDGKRVGVAKWYFSSKALMLVANYKDGKLDGECRQFDIVGRLRRNCTFRNGVLEGLEENYFVNGKKFLQSDYVGGKINNTQKLFQEDGINLQSELDYQDGVKQGNLKIYDEKGLLLKTIPFVNDEKQDVKLEKRVEEVIKKMDEVAPNKEEK